VTAADGTDAAPLAEVLDLLTERIVRYRIDDLTVQYCNTAWAEANGGRVEDFLGQRLDVLLTSAEREGLDRVLYRLGPETPVLHDNMTETRGGRWTEWTDQYLSGPNGPQVLAVGRDVTERRAAERRLAASEERYRELALRDDLTGLANRRLLDELLAAALARARRSAMCLVVSYLDLDDFKPINDEYGHAVGDAVLVEVGRRLHRTVRGADVIARVGGDEFVVVQECRPDQANRSVARLRAILAEPVELPEVTIACGVSVGSVVARPGQGAADVVAAADAAMYEEKRHRARAYPTPAGRPTVDAPFPV